MVWRGSAPARGGKRVAYVIDVTTWKDLERQFSQANKMQAVGQLTGGVAHDFNNLLTAVRLNTDELLNRHPVGDPDYGELQAINSTVARAAAKSAPRPLLGHLMHRVLLLSLLRPSGAEAASAGST